MAFCRGRLFFETRPQQRSHDSAIIQVLNFNQCDSDNDGECYDGDGVSDGDVRPAGSPAFHRGDTTPDMDNSFLWDSGLCSPTPKSLQRRNVRYPPKENLSPVPFSMYDSDEADGDNAACPVDNSLTPPHKKLRSLRLYDTPHTPKSLLQKAQRRITRLHRAKKTSLPQESVISKETPSNVRVPSSDSRVQANVNPFTPASDNHIGHSGTKRSRPELDRSFDDSLDEEMEEDLPCTKKLALHDINLSRYHEEFLQTDKLGDGEFGAVHKCIHRLDGCTYAIKKSKTPVAGSVYERTAMNEVYAHAVLGKHPHVVRYFSAWAENDHMYIQNEYCNGGSLADVLASEGPLSEAQLKQVLLHCARGLRYIHSQKLVHLDIKPGNIFLHSDPKQSSESGLEEDLEDTEEDVTYKIGDLGHVTSLTATSVEEGDCRYLPAELLRDSFEHLPKADIFSLALTIWEAGGGGELPKNGDSWQAIRRGELPPLESCSTELNHLLLSMVQPDPRARPSAASLCQHPTLCPFARKTRQQLRQELNEERFKNELLTRQLKAATEHNQTTADGATAATGGAGGGGGNIVTHVLPSQVGAGRSSRLIGKKVNRSMSLTCF